LKQLFIHLINSLSLPLLLSHIAESECESILSGNTEVEFRKSELYSLGSGSGRASSWVEGGKKGSSDKGEAGLGAPPPGWTSLIAGWEAVPPSPAPSHTPSQRIYLNHRSMTKPKVRATMVYRVQ
jgi:hypothetical protein